MSKIRFLLVVLFQLTRSLPLKRWLQLGGTLVLSWFCLRLSLWGWMSMIDPGYISFFGGQFINAQYLCALALIPISFCSLNRKAQRNMFLFVVYGSLPIAFLVIYLIRYFTIGLWKWPYWTKDCKEQLFVHLLIVVLKNHIFCKLIHFG